MTATQARQNLGSILTRVIQGEDIGIVHSGSGKIIALRPVEVKSEDYAEVEYGLTKAELKRAEKNILKKLKSEKTKRWDGTAQSLRG
jgi:antitoxin (DNA-binding transcriptional repressor) of toxin-antitoxin stability system